MGTIQPKKFKKTILILRSNKNSGKRNRIVNRVLAYYVVNLV